MPEYSLIDLAKLAAVTPRTIRYYIAQGLLPSPEAAGPRTAYSDEHLKRLLLIKQMQASGMPLATIRAQLRSMGAIDLDEPARVSESAVDYIRGVLGTGRAPVAPAAAIAPATPPAPAVQSVPPETPEPDRSQWDRVGITPDLEVHIRRPASRTDQKRVNRLIEYARQLFREE